MDALPRKDADFNVAQENISSTADANRLPWKLDGEWLDDSLLPAREIWTGAYAKYLLPTTRTTVITFSKNEARSNYEQLLRMLVKGLQVNPRVTDDDLKQMNINIPSKGRKPIPVPVTYPVATADSSVIRRLGIHFRDSSGTSNAKPRGVHGAEIKWGIGIAVPDDAALLPNSSFDTHTPLILEFTEADRGKPVHFCLRWENTTGAKGPWGEIATAIVP